GVGDVCDSCPDDPLNAPTWDGLRGSVPNCRDRFNPLQHDRDGDRIGDACDGHLPADFLPARLYRGGTSFSSILAVDVNGDGRLDLVTTDTIPDSNTSLVVLLGLEGGGFTAPRASYGGPYPTRAIAGDFNEDGKVDLAVANSSNMLVILLGLGDGSFQAPRFFRAFGAPVVDVDLFDFDLDGHQDLVVTSGGVSTSSGAYEVLRGSGDGGFTRWISGAGTGDERPHQAAVADFDGDGYPDLAVVRLGQVSIGFGHGISGFSFLDPIPVPYRSEDAQVGDLDHDGLPDLVVLANFNAGLTMLLSRPGRTFEKHVDPTVLGTSLRVADAD